MAMLFRFPIPDTPTNRYAIVFMIHCDIVFKAALLPELGIHLLKHKVMTPLSYWDTGIE